MKIAKFEIICKNCDNLQNTKFGCKHNHNGKTCQDFVPMAELYELAHECDYDDVKWVEAKPQTEEPVKPKNPFLYKTEVEDWKDHHKKIWRLSVLLEPTEWKQVSKYFKYYKNRNLIGWGTTSPLEVTEILTTLKGDKQTQSLLNEINEELEKIKQSRLNGYGQWHDFDWEAEAEDKYNEKLLKNQKRELLGFA